MVFATRGCDGMLAGSTVIFASPLRVFCNRLEINLTTCSMLEPETNYTVTRCLCPAPRGEPTSKPADYRQRWDEDAPNDPQTIT